MGLQQKSQHDWTDEPWSFTLPITGYVAFHQPERQRP
jgi:hypothetical protein